MRRLLLTVVLIICGLLLGLLLASKVKATCYPIEVTEWSPSGTAGCETYGTGIASWWSGPGVAVNSCTYPWTACTPITIRSLETGTSITVTPSQYCDCFTGTQDERLVDLDSSALKALGLWELRSQGLFRVQVEPATRLPDTAMR